MLVGVCLVRAALSACVACVRSRVSPLPPLHTHTTGEGVESTLSALETLQEYNVSASTRAFVCISTLTPSLFSPDSLPEIIQITLRPQQLFNNPGIERHEISFLRYSLEFRAAAPSRM